MESNSIDNTPIYIGLFVDKDTKKKLKLIAAEQHMTQKALYQEALQMLFQKYNKS